MLQILFNGLDRVRTWNLDPTFSLGLSGVFLIVLAILLIRSRMNYLSLPVLPARPAQAEPPDCMVVIPARNEAGLIGRAVHGLPPDSVLVVDDGSTDSTAAEAEEAGAGVLHVAKLPKGVIGKPHACMIGARAITTKWILFADADTWYEPGMLESVIHAAEVNDLSFLSVYLDQRAEGFAARMIAPYMEALFFSGISPKECPEGAFFGQCILVRRAAHEFIGGHAAGLAFLTDDLKLALLAQRHRMKFGTARTSTLGHATAHRGWDELWDGIRRNSYRFVLISGWHGAALLLTALLAALWLPLALLAAAGGWTPVAMGVALAPLLLLLPWYGFSFRVLLAPFATYAILPILGNALLGVLTTTHVFWKDREV